MSVTALFSTAGTTNAGLYPAAGLCEQMASIGQFPPVLGRRLGGRAPMGLLITAAVAIVLAAGFNLSSIASIGSAIALLVFTLVTAAHFRVRGETGGSTLVLDVGWNASAPVASAPVASAATAFSHDDHAVVPEPRVRTVEPVGPDNPLPRILRP
jgi:amino acid transporter